jgi:hypothetical protein
MNPISQSIKLMLLHSKVFLAAIVVYIIFTVMLLLLKDMPEIRALVLIFQVSIFLGIYLGGGLTSLKKSYLWKNNTKYKNSNLSAFFLVILLVNALLVLFIYPDIKLNKLVLFMPFCVSVFASQMVIGKNIMYKILIPAIPVMLIWLRDYGLDLQSSLLLIIASTVVLMFSMYKNLFYSYGVNQGVENKSSANTVAYMTTGLNSTQLNAINAKIGEIVARWIQVSKKRIDWAILMPHTRLTFISLFYLISFFALMLVSGEKLQPFTQVLSLTFLPMVMLGIIIESRHLIKQTKMFSHVYKGINHRQLKNKILTALDKNLTINVLVFLVGLFTIIKTFSIAVFAKILIASLLFIYFFSMSLYPLLMCLNWVNISFTLIVLMFSYTFIIYKSVKWIALNISLVLLPQYIISFVLVCIALRVITQYLFWNRSIEALMKKS